MTTIQSPSHALGLMAMGAYQQIMNTIPETLLSVDGPKKMYGLILGLDGMMYSFSDKMYHYQIQPDGSVIRRDYTEMMKELRRRQANLKLGNSSDNYDWLIWFHDYLKLLSSCFNQIGLAPLKMSDNLDWNEQPYIPPEHRTDSQPDDETIPSQSLESDSSG